MPRKRPTPDHQELLDMKLSELTALIHECSAVARVEIAFERYEDEDAHIDVYLPAAGDTAEVQRLALVMGERCNEILLQTGLCIIGAVWD